MIVTVMHVWKMYMNVRDHFVGMLMAMSRPNRHRLFMRMLMVFVVDVFVFMLQGLMGMFMLMPLGEMQPNSERHQACGEQQLIRDSLADATWVASMPKTLLSGVSPWLLAGLLYLGSGVGLTLYRKARRASGSTAVHSFRDSQSAGQRCR